MIEVIRWGLSDSVRDQKLLTRERLTHGCRCYTVQPVIISLFNKKSHCCNTRTKCNINTHYSSTMSMKRKVVVIYYSAMSCHYLFNRLIFFSFKTSKEIRRKIPCLFMKLFKTSNIDIVKCCQEHFGFELPSVIWSKRVKKFEAKFFACNNLLCNIIYC